MSKANYDMHESIAPGGVVKAAARQCATRLRRVGIVGAGATGIAMNLLDADMPVTLFDTERASTVGAVATVRSAYERQVAAGRLTSDQRDRRLALLAGAANFHHLKDCDLILATLPSDLPAAEKLFRRLDELVTRNTIFVTRHALPELAQLARCTRRPADVLGMRCANPADPLSSFELVRGKETSQDAFATVDALVKSWGQV